MSQHHKPGPITREPNANGNVLVFQRDNETRYVVLPPGITLWLSTAGVPLRLNHFAECASADRFRARRHDSNAPLRLAPDPPEEAA